jgi:hypothetical protein
MFGTTRDELIGKLVEALVPERFRLAHTELRSQYHSEPTARPMGIGLRRFCHEHHP